jgi:hypothetical protein
MNELRRNHQYAQKRRLNEHIDLNGIQEAGFKVRRLTPYCYRINERLDLYPIKKRYFDIDTKEWGDYHDSIGICRMILEMEPIQEHVCGEECTEKTNIKTKEPK